MADKDWESGLLRDLIKEGYLSVESVGVLNGKDVITAIDAIKQIEKGRDEAAEWEHIKKLQRERDSLPNKGGYAVSGEKRNPVGIGNIVIGTNEGNLGIPRLHFIVYKSGETVYEAVNLEFGLVSTGASGTEAVAKLAVLTTTYAASVLKEGNGYKELRKTAVENAEQGYWSEYRGVKFDLAQIGSGLNQDLNKRINRAVQEAFIAKIKEALKDGAEEEVISLFTSACSVRVTYKEARVKTIADDDLIGGFYGEYARPGF
jgi:hypothetical protein